MSEARTLGLLRALCSGLAAGGIDVVADDQRTAFMPDHKRIMIARRFLSADTKVAIGALLHEVGHALVTRYHLFAEPADTWPALWREALNAVEETRIHRFLRRRLPGAAGTLDALFAMDEAPDAVEFESDLVVFLMATAICDRHPDLPFLACFPAAAQAFQRTETARTGYTRALPPPDLVPMPYLGERYERLVVPILDPRHSGGLVPLEAELRCAAASALGIFRARIWPIILTLAARDQARIARSLIDDPDLRAAAERDDAASVAGRPELARRALRTSMGVNDARAIPESPPDEDLAKLAGDLFRRYLEADFAQPQTRSRRVTRAGATPDCDAPPDRGSDAMTPPAAGSSDEETQRTSRALADVLRHAIPRRPMKWTSGYRSGRAIDLDRVMRAAATGRDGDRIWLRRTQERPALAALLLVDLSGSMAGKKVAAAIAATRALSAALEEVRGISWCVLGFQDTTIPFVGFHERAEPRVLARIEEMDAEAAGRRPGGNNQPRYNDDGPCLLEAAAMLQARPERDRLLMVISDGNPEGRRSGRDDLHRAVEQVQAMPGLTLIGLGLGPSTAHVTRYYPVSRANIALGDLAPSIALLLAAGLRTAA